MNCKRTEGTEKNGIWTCRATGVTQSGFVRCIATDEALNEANSGNCPYEVKGVCVRNRCIWWPL